MTDSTYRSMFLSNKRRDRMYGKPDLAASKEAGMQDKTEFENKVLLLHFPEFGCMKLRANPRI
jgi:hypothetical protein